MVDLAAMVMAGSHVTVRARDEIGGPIIMGRFAGTRDIGIDATGPGGRITLTVSSRAFAWSERWEATGVSWDPSAAYAFSMWKDARWLASFTASMSACSPPRGGPRWPGPWSMPMNEGEVEPEITECLRRLADAVSRLTEVAGQGPTTEPSIDLLTADELAERFRISARTIRDQAAAGQIPHHRFGKHYRFSNEDIDEILRQTKKAPRHRLRRPKGGRSAA